MRRSNAWMLLLAVFLLTPTAVAAKKGEEQNLVEAVPVPPSRDEICRMIEAAAAKEQLPFDFFTRLIWRESRFDPGAVSPAGAQGIAQFMPKTANGRGLENPFDPLTALHESAEYLRELLQRFGNLGLAAAAYNAGPKRIRDWLDKRGPPLRQETHDYVEIVTGHSPHTWAADEAPPVETVHASDCDQIARLAIARQVRIAAHAKRLARQNERRKAQLAEKAAETRSGKLAESSSRARVASAAKGAAKSRLHARTDKVVKLTGDRRKAGQARSGRKASEKIRTAGDAVRAPRPVRVAATAGKRVERSCSQARNGGRKACRDA